MAFNTDYNEVNESNVLPAGEYEVIIKYACGDVTKINMKAHIAITLVIRNDVDQSYKNKHIWYKLWKRKEPSAVDISVGGYSIKQINTLSRAAGLQNGKSYDSLEDWFQDLQDKPIRVTTKVDEQYGAEVQYVNESKYPDCQHVYKGKDTIPSSATDYDPVNDDELPF